MNHSLNDNLSHRRTIAAAIASRNEGSSHPGRSVVIAPMSAVFLIHNTTVRSADDCDVRLG